MRVAICGLLLLAGALAAQDPCVEAARVEEVGVGTAGAGGIPRLLAKSLPLIGGAPTSIRVVGGPGGTSGVLALGTSEDAAPVPDLGGLVYPAGELRTYPFVLDARGTALVDVSGLMALSPGQCGQTWVAQAAIADATAAGGFALSAGLRLTVGVGPASATAPLLNDVPVLTAERSIAVRGSGVTPFHGVRVEGGAQPVETVANPAGRFEVDVPLASNAVQTLFVREVGGGGTLSPAAVVTVTHDAEPPLVLIDFPADGTIVNSDTINVSGVVSDALSGFMGLDVAVDGVPAAVNVGIGTNGTFDLAGVLLGAGGPVTLTAVATDALGNSASDTVTVVFNPPSGAALELLAGADQGGMVNTELPTPLQVRAETLGGAPLAGTPVTFEVVKSDGRLAPTSGAVGAMKVTVLTDAAGDARVWWTLGSDAGMGNNRVRVSSAGLEGALFACASATADLGALKLNVGTGRLQLAQADGTAPEPLVVWANDGQNPLVGVPVVFEVVQGTGVVEDPELGGLRGGSLEVLTDLGGHAAVRYVAGGATELARVEARIQGSSGSPAVFQVRTVAPDGLGTRVSGVVRDNALQGLGGASIRLEFDAGAMFATTTDVGGRFTFTDVAASGAAHLIVEGGSATTLGGLPIDPLAVAFPELAQELFVVADAANVLPRPILLPPIDPSSLVTFDGTETVELTMSAVEGLAVTVPAGTLVTRPDGSVVDASDPIALSISPVHVDDIPMPLPDGASAPLAWTLQPGGTTFDPPLSITLPNMAGLPAGAVAYVLVFDHDTGNFEIVAPAAVDADGGLIRSLPGTGIAEAGWGGFCPPYPDTGDVGNECEPDDPRCVDCAEDPEIAQLRAEGDALWAQAQAAFASGGSLAAIEELVSVAGCILGAVDFYKQFQLTVTVCLVFPGPVCILFSAGLAVVAINLAFDCVAAYLGGVEELTDAVEAYKDGSALASEALVKYSQAEAMCGKLQFDAKVQAVQALVSQINAAIEKANSLAAGLVALAAEVQALIDALNAWKQLIEELLGGGPLASTSGGGDEIPQEIIDTYFMDVDPSLEVALVSLEAALVGTEDLMDSVAAVDLATQATDDAFTNAICTAEAGGLTAPVDPSGEFRIQSVPIGAPARVTIVCDGVDATYYAQSEYVSVVDQGSVAVGDLAFGTTPPPATLSISASTATAALSSLGETTQIDATALLSDGSTPSVAGLVDGVGYTSSAPTIVSVDTDGLVTAQGSGPAFVTVTKDGAAATIKLTVSLGDPLTEVQGTIVDASLAPVADADVETTLGFQATSAVDGAFSIDGHPTTVDPLRVDASSGALFGFAITPVVGGGTTAFGTIVVDVDTDGDTLPDWYEVNLYDSDPTLTDTDGDGLTDNVEVLQLGTDPGLADTDGDGFDDAFEDLVGSDPLVLDAPTTLTGTAELPGRVPAAGAEVSVLDVPPAVFSAIADGAGAFTFADPWPASLSPVTLRATATSGGGDFSGLSEPTPTVAGGVTFVGPFVLAELEGGPLFPGAKYPVANGPERLRAADVDADGDLDLVALGGNLGTVLLGEGDGAFVAGENVALANTPSDAIVTDVDGDGMLDVVATYSSQNQVGILLGDGTGVFGPPTFFGSSGFLSSVDVADLDGDGIVDIVVTSDFLDLVSVHRGVGGGAFAPAATYAVANDPQVVRIADVDVDGELDVVTGTRFGGVSVLLGFGDGTLAPATTLPVDDQITDLEIADLGGNGLPDLVLATNTVSVQVLYGLGGGTFTIPLEFFAGGPSDIEIADLDGDGALDVAGSAGDTLAVLFGLGNGQFGEVSTFLSGEDTSAVAVADYDADGVLDVAVANEKPDDVTVFLGDGSRAFGALVVDATDNVADARAADFDADGTLDLAAIGFDDVAVLLGQGDLVFGAPQAAPAGDAPVDLLVADLDADGLLDVVVANEGQLFGGGGDVRVLSGIGGGAFAPAVTYLAGPTPQSVVAADLDGDGALDLAVASGNGFSVGDVSVLLGVGDGTFGPAITAASGGAPVSVAAGDLDGDGVLDLAVVDIVADEASVLLGIGDGTFVAGSVSAVGDSPTGITIGDLDADGLLDVVVANTADDTVSVLLGMGGGAFGPALTLPVGTQPRSVAIGDLDADGVLDLAVANEGFGLGPLGDVSVLLGLGDGTFAPEQRFVAGSGAESIQIADIDGDGEPDLVCALLNGGDVALLVHE